MLNDPNQTLFLNYLGFRICFWKKVMEGHLESQIRGLTQIEMKRWGRIGIKMREFEK